MPIPLSTSPAASLTGPPPLLASGNEVRTGNLFPPVPTLLATRLQLEFLLSERSVDLRAAAGIILNDLGATIEIFRRAGEDEDSGTVCRMEDCLASLGTDVWMDAICADAVERIATSSQHLAHLTAFWERSRSLAYACWVFAEDAEGVCREEAYLVGLLHQARHLPALLGWSCPAELTTLIGVQSAVTDEAVVATLAQHWKLPEFLRAIVTAPYTPPLWRELLNDAQAWLRGDEFIPGQIA